MANDRDQFLVRLLETFRVEAVENLSAISRGLTLLAHGDPPERARAIEEIFRETHTLKGAARAVNFVSIEAICHSMENLFAALKAKRIEPTPALLALAQRAVDRVTAALHAPPSDYDAMATSLARDLDRAATVAKGPPSPSPAPPLRAPDSSAAPAPAHVTPRVAPAAATGTLRIHASRLDAILRHSEELLGPRLASAQRLIELGETRQIAAQWRRERDAIRAARSTLQRAARREDGSDLDEHAKSQLTQVLDYFDSEGTLLKDLEARVVRLEQRVEADHRDLSGIVDRLLDQVKEAQMLPFSSVVDGLARLVREVAQNQGKQATLVVHGGDIEIDRRILEELKAPLQHLLRNAVDHGIEQPPARVRRGKPEIGCITLTVTHRINRADITLADDGAGIDVAGVRSAAAALGVMPPEQVNQLEEDEVLGLLYQSGLSTSPTVTHISGRGLGLPIVREKVIGLGGSLDIETQRDAGTKICIDVPLTLATFRGVLVMAGEQRFVLPISGVDRVARIRIEEIRPVENRETIVLDDRTIPFVWLADAIEIPRPRRDDAIHAHVVVLGNGAGRIGFGVDAVVAEQPVLVKGLGPQLPCVRNVAGATVLGSGAIVPVLSVSDLLESVTRSGAPRGRAISAVEAPARRSILVVEDSITSRMLLKNILEASGYDVAVAVDGIDGLTQLKTGRFDLVVSDVEMPRMNGFELTAKLRADPALAATPVVLVTALASREDRERGIDAGANAYIVKSSFDQSDLLDVVRRFL